MTGDKEKLKSLRDEIDSIDSEISALLNRRFECVAAIADIKNQNGMPVYDGRREAEILSRVTKACHGINEKDCKDIYRAVFKASKNYEEARIKGYDMRAALVGTTLKQSFSPEIHSALNTLYDLAEVPEDGLKAFASGGEYKYYNVTMPYKKTIIPYLDYVDEEAKLIGAVNTVFERDGKKWGYNTDIGGIEHVFKHFNVDVCGKTAVIMGSGATSLTALYYLKKHGAKDVFVISRNGKYNYKNYDKLDFADILINTTPVGMYPDIFNAPVELKKFKNPEFVFDVVYNPFKTALITQAEELGIPSSGGLMMLVAQAVLSESLWRGKDLTADIFTIYKNLLCKRKNIVLIGMPSCGKTTVGKAVAKMLSRKFYDTDELCAARIGCDVASFIETNGESAFRKAEAEVVKNLAPLNGAVIATGGGTVLNKDIANALKMNGFTIYLDRDISLLTCKNRPISRLNGINKLYEERNKIYMKAADASVKNNCDIQTVAKWVIDNYEKHLDN